MEVEGCYEHQHTDASGIELIVMTTHGHGGLARFWLGSVADALVHSSTVPILLLRPDAVQLERWNASAPQRILVPLDGSAFAEQILDHALALDGTQMTDYILLSVVRPLTSFGAALFTTPTDLDPDDTRRRVREARGYLNQIAQTMRATGAKAYVCVLVAEQPAIAIMTEARRQHVDLIAMATHGHNGSSSPINQASSYPIPVGEQSHRQP